MTASPLLAQLEPLHTQAYGWALHCCGGDAHAAEEALQTAYCRVAEGGARFAGNSNLKTWWLGVVRLVALEQRRRAFWRLEKLRAWFAADGRIGRDASPNAAENNDLLAIALAQLPPRQREVLHLVFYQDLSVAEAADAMSVSLGSARQHYERAKSRLRRLLTTHERV